MAYAPSRARADCDLRLGELRRIGVSASARGVSFDIRQAALQGVIAQMHSALEEYFRRVIEDWLRALHLLGMTSGTIPLRLRTWYAHQPFFDEYKYYSYQANEQRFLDATSVSAYDLAYFSAGNPLPATTAADGLIGTSGYPSEKNIKRVFSRIGIVDTNAYLSRKLGISLHLFMEAVSATRGSVTHKNAPILVRSDILSFENKISRLVRWLDHRLRKEIIASSSSAVWAQMR